VGDIDIPPGQSARRHADREGVTAREFADRYNRVIVTASLRSRTCRRELVVDIAELASSQGRTFKAWLERAIAAEVERQETERAEDERRRRRSR
jgi:hypothetical protein